MNEETKSQFQESLEKMYELGVEHGYQLAEKDQKIKQLQQEIEKLGV